jgi:hypothetical protein
LQCEIGHAAAMKSSWRPFLMRPVRRDLRTVVGPVRSPIEAQDSLLFSIHREACLGPAFLIRSGAFLLQQRAGYRRLPDRRRRPWSHSQTAPLSLIVRRGLFPIPRTPWRPRMAGPALPLGGAFLGRGGLLHPCDYPGAGRGGPLLRGRYLTPWAVKSGLAAQIVGVRDNQPLVLAVWALVFGTRRQPRAVTPIAFDHRSQLHLRVAQGQAETLWPRWTAYADLVAAPA